MGTDRKVLDEALSRNDKSKALVILCALLTISASLNVLLARKISRLRLSNSSIASTAQLQVGVSVPPLSGHSVEGKPMLVSFADVSSPTLIYVFSPQCSWCAKNLSNFRALIAQAGGRYRVVGIAVSHRDLAAYLTRENLQIPVLADADPAVMAAYALMGTPTTIVVSNEGRVLNIWNGAYAQGTREQIEAALGVHLLPCCDREPQPIND